MPAAGSSCLRVTAVLPAGGSGSRLENPKPKQFIEVDGRPIYSYALETFVRHPWIQRVALVIPPSYRVEVREFIDAKIDDSFDSDSYVYRKVILVDGAETRHRSIRNGIAALRKSTDNESLSAEESDAPSSASLASTSTFQSLYNDIVVIHDAVRPFLDNSTLERVVNAAGCYGAAGTVRPLVSTVVRPDKEGFLAETLVRADHCASEMPQAFYFPMILNAYEACSVEDLDLGTECLEVARKYGGARPFLVEGGENLWKVTYAKDVEAMANQIEREKKNLKVTSVKPIE